MPHNGEPLSTSSLIALANEQLFANGYRVVRDISEMTVARDRALVAEDAFSVIWVVAYETWGQLAAEWTDAQADLVELLSRRLARSAPKAWDGYLVLLCAGEPLDRAEVSRIERDTRRVRKLVATSSMLQTTADIARVLEPLLPLAVPAGARAIEDVLEALPDLMRTKIDPGALRVVVDAYRAMEAPLERLHAYRGGQ